MIRQICCGMLPLLLVLLSASLGCASQQNKTPKTHYSAKGRAERVFRTGLERASKKEWSEAARSFLRALELKPSLKAAHLNAAISLEKSGRLNEALWHYQSAYEQTPAHPLLNIGYARVLLMLDRFEHVIKLTDTFVDDTALELEHRVAIYLQRASALQSMGRYREAKKVLKDLLIASPNHVGALNGLASIAIELGEHKRAEMLLANAGLLSSTEPSIYEPSIQVNWGLLELKKSNLESAVNHFERALQQDPHFGSAHGNLGYLALQYGDHDQAVDRFGMAMKGGYNSCHQMAALGYALARSQKGDEAIAQLLLTHRLCPHDKDVLFIAGSVCDEQKQDTKCALEHYSSFVSAHKELPKKHVVFERIKDIENRQDAMTVQEEDLQNRSM